MHKARHGPSPLVALGVLVVVLFAAVLGFLLYRSQQAGTEASIPPGAIADGVVVGQPDAPVTVDVYLDFQCPVCARYEREVGPTLAQLIESGHAKVVYHPVAFLDRFSSTRYSSRSSAAAARAGLWPLAQAHAARHVELRLSPDGAVHSEVALDTGGRPLPRVERPIVQGRREDSGFQLCRVAAVR